MSEVHSNESDKGRKKSGHPACKIALRILLQMFIFLRYYFDMVVDTLFGFYYNSSKESVECTTNPIILESAASLAKKIRKRQLTSEEVVSAFIERIKEVNGVINAVVDERFEDALKEAREIDRDIAIGTIQDVDFQQRPFIGIPFTTKESTACKGMASTFGLASRRHRKSKEDAEVVELMKKAGGILIGVTNVPPLNLWTETTNRIYGTTKNPYNTTRNVGGSSGGEASILAAGGSAIGIGSDIGGSIRIPCFMCGIFGHKPTSDLINTRGLTFRSGNEKKTMVVPGPMTRYAEDITPLLKVLLGPNADKLSLNERVNIKELKVCYIVDPKDPYVSTIREEMNKVLLRTVNYFGEVCNQSPELVEFEGTQYAGKLWMYWMTQEENSDFRRDITDRQGEVGLKEILKFAVGKSEHDASTMYNIISGSLPKAEENWVKSETEKLRKQIIDKLGPNGILLYPSAPFPASFHNTTFVRPFNFNLFSIFNALKLPVTQVPLGLGEEGLPVGIQVVTSPYRDHVAIAVARELEKQFGGYVPPFKLKK